MIVSYNVRKQPACWIINDFGRCGLRDAYETGDNIQVQELFSIPDLNVLKEYIAGYQLLVIDEAQKIKNIGQVMKLLIDNISGLMIIATGSSSFDLAGQVG